MAENPKKETIDKRQLYYVPTLPVDEDKWLVCFYENQKVFWFFEEAITPNERDGGVVRFKYPFSMHCFDIPEKPITEQPLPYRVYTIEISTAGPVPGTEMFGGLFSGLFFCAFDPRGHKNFGPISREEVQDPKAVLLKFLAKELGGEDAVFAALKENRLKIIPFKNLKK